MTTATVAETTSPPSGLIAAYGLALLFLANLLNFADRALLGIVVEPIRKELLLSDTELSLVTGLSFSVVYLIAGVLIARWVDIGNRRLILVLGIIVWSGATAATGMAQGFVSLAATRMLIGIGEAVVFPVAMSLIADMYPGPKLPRSVSIFQSSAGVGILLGSMLAGILAAALGWRTMFQIFGVAGLGLALLIALTMRATPRTRLSEQEVLEASKLFPAMRAIMKIPGLAWLAFGYGASHMLMHCLPAWAPAFLQRSHGVELANVGVLIGPPAVIGGVLGTILSGALAGKIIQREGHRAAGLIVPIVAMPLAVPAYLLFLFSPSLPVVLTAVGVMNFLLSSAFGACVALAVAMVGPHRRALTSTMLLIVQTVVGLAFGPLLVGILSDALAPTYGADSLRYALAIMIFAPPFAALLLWIARGRIAES